MHPVMTVKSLSRSNQRFRSYRTFWVFTLGPLVVKSVIESSRNLVSRLTLPRGIYVASFRSIAQVDTKRAVILYNRHFLRNLTQITRKSKSNQKPGDIMCILIKCSHSKNFVKIGPTVQELSHFLCFHVRPPGGQVINRIGPKKFFQSPLTQGNICSKFQVISFSGYETCHQC